MTVLLLYQTKTMAFLFSQVSIVRPNIGILLDECGCNFFQEEYNNFSGEPCISSVSDKVYHLVSSLLSK